MTTLVVIDDNPDYRLLVRLALQREGSIDVVGEAGDATSGIALAAELKPDLILLDVILPGMDGIAAVPLLRDAAPNAAIVAVSAYPEHQLWGRSRAAATVPYVSKALAVTQLPVELMRVATASTSQVGVASESERFVAELHSARTARKFARAVLEKWECHSEVDSVELLVSELVTNAVIHARSDVELVLTLRPDSVRAEVIDSTDAYVHRRDADDDSQSGRGIALIESLATSWGIDTLVGGKAVWFEVARGHNPGDGE